VTATVTGARRRRPVRAIAESVRLLPASLRLRSRLTIDANGGEDLPDTGGAALIVANYASVADPALVRGALPRSWRRRTVVALPSRDTDGVTSALADGLHVLAFPEGHRSPDGFLAQFQSELAALAISEAVGVVPVGIRGSYAAVQGEDLPPTLRSKGVRPRVSVRIGSILRAEADESADQFAARWHGEVRRLIEEDASSWWTTQREIGRRAPLPPGSSWRRIWEQTEAPAAGGRPRRPKIWRS
jgi:1-acyl-sn-glycerol-3-phosphate acyltransferase